MARDCHRLYRRRVPSHRIPSQPSEAAEIGGLALHVVEYHRRCDGVLFVVPHRVHAVCPPRSGVGTGRGGGPCASAQKTMVRRSKITALLGLQMRALAEHKMME